MTSFARFDPAAFLEAEEDCSEAQTVATVLCNRSVAGVATVAGLHTNIERGNDTKIPSPSSSSHSHGFVCNPATVATSATLRFYNTVAPFAVELSRLERTCPDFIDPPLWRQAVADAQHFMREYGETAAALGWTAEELFGLPKVPANPVALYRRLSRYDQLGLIWLLTGKPVVGLTESSASIQHKSGSITVYRKHNKPALGPLGDSLDDLT